MIKQTIAGVVLLLGVSSFLLAQEPRPERGTVPSRRGPRGDDRSPERNPARSNGGQQSRGFMRGEAGPYGSMPELRQFGVDLFKIAETEAGGLDPAMRAFSLLQISYAYGRTEKEKALELLENALTGARDVDEDKVLKIRSDLQRQILQAMVPLAPERVDELIMQVEPAAREAVLKSMLGYYMRKRNMDRAMELISQIGVEGEIPYGAVGRLMMMMYDDKTGEGLRLFNLALSSYKTHSHEYSSFTAGKEDTFIRLIMSSSRQLPKNVVSDSISEVLNQAQKADSDRRSSAVGSQSAYESSLMALLPVLRQADESKAKELAEKNRTVGAVVQSSGNAQVITGLQRVPDTTPNRGGPGRMGGGRFGSGVSAGSGVVQEGRGFDGKPVTADSLKNTLAQITGVQDSFARTFILDMFARTSANGSDTSAIKEALRNLPETVKKEPLENQPRLLASGAQIWSRMGDTDAAATMVEKALAAAEKLYKSESSGDDQNYAPKFYWVSTAAYRDLMQIAGGMSPVWAMSVVKDISDLDVRVSAEIALAAKWMGVPGSSAKVVKLDKKAAGK